MATNYRRQYRRDQLEAFFPNEINKMVVVVLTTLAVIMFFVILPVLLDWMGLHGFEHHEEPADPHGATPVGIKPEWYFLGTYQYLRLMPTKFLGMSGKTLGVLSQGVIVTVVILLPFWYRKRAHQFPTTAYRIGCTIAIFAFIALTIWGGWPEVLVDGEERLAPFSVYFAHQPMMILLTPMALLVFFLLMQLERKNIRKILDAPPPKGMPDAPEDPTTTTEDH